MSQGLSILGSTGSIGCNTLRVAEFLGDEFRVVALGAGGNMAKLAEQIERFTPELVAVGNDAAAEELARLLHAKKVALPRLAVGTEGLVAVATHPAAACVVSATVGAIGFVPTLRALEAGKRVALANKETLVMAGALMTRAAERNGAQILPVDSEHNALHQCLRGEQRREVKRLILTASGGPFRCKTKDDMQRATVADALNHPTWNMGAKITIDSATLMNKGLEVIEAHWLFGFSADAIDVLVHPESIVHSLIELVDGSLIAQMGVTDMRHAIQYALTYPQRRASELPPLDLAQLSTLHFATPDTAQFPCLALAYRALRAGGTMPAALNAANEIAVQAFLDEKIRLTDIPHLLASVMDAHQIEPADSLETILAADHAARQHAAEIVAKFAVKSETTAVR